MAQHTPGPWRLHEDGLAVFGANGHQVIDADVCSAALRSEERTANARLIAAAPDLEAALEPYAELGYDLTDMICHRNLVPVEKCGRCGRVLAARAALAKAKGVKP